MSLFGGMDEEEVRASLGMDSHNLGEDYNEYNESYEVDLGESMIGNMVGVDANETVLHSRLSAVSSHTGSDSSMPDYMIPSEVRSLDPNSYEVTGSQSSNYRSASERSAMKRINEAYDQGSSHKAIDALGQIMGDEDSFTGNYKDRQGGDFQALNQTWKVNGQGFEDALGNMAQNYFTDDLPDHLKDLAYGRASMFLGKQIPKNIQSMKPAMGGSGFVGYADALPRVKGLGRELVGASFAQDKMKEIASYLKPQGSDDDNITTLFGFPRNFGENNERNELYTNKKSDVRSFVQDIGRVHGVSLGAASDEGRRKRNSYNGLAVQSDTDLNYSDIANNAAIVADSMHDLDGGLDGSSSSSAMSQAMQAQRDALGVDGAPSGSVPFSVLQNALDGVGDSDNDGIFNPRTDHGPMLPSSTPKTYRDLESPARIEAAIGNRPVPKDAGRTSQPSNRSPSRENSKLDVIKALSDNVTYSDNEQGTAAWKAERLGVATATDANVLLTGRETYGKDTSLTSHLDKIRESGNRDKDDNPMFEIGHMGEEQGARLFKEAYGHDLVESGMASNSKYPGLGVSPDRMYRDENGQLQLIEFKTSTRGGGDNLSGTDGLMAKHRNQLHMQLAVTEADQVELRQVWSENNKAFAGNPQDYKGMKNSDWKSRSAGFLKRDSEEHQKWVTDNAQFLNDAGEKKAAAIESGDYTELNEMLEERGTPTKSASNMKLEQTAHKQSQAKQQEALDAISAALTGDGKGLYRALMGGGGGGEGGGGAGGLLAGASPKMAKLAGWGQVAAKLAEATYSAVEDEAEEFSNIKQRGMGDRKRESKQSTYTLDAAGALNAEGTTAAFESMQAQASVGKMGAMSNTITQTRGLISAKTLMSGSTSDAAAEFVTNARERGLNDQEMAGMLAGTPYADFIQLDKDSDLEKVKSDSAKAKLKDTLRDGDGATTEAATTLKRLGSSAWSSIKNFGRDILDDPYANQADARNQAEFERTHSKMKLDVEIKGNTVSVKSSGDVEETTNTIVMGKGSEAI